MTDTIDVLDSTRREFIERSLIAGSAALFGGVAPAFLRNAHAADFGKPEKTDLTIGFIPLTDCASVVMAGELGLYKKYGLNVTISKEASWAAVRDKLLLGQLDAAHVLYGLVYGAHLGIGSQKKDMAILLDINYNGQAITLSKKLADAGIKDGASLKKAVDKKDCEYTFAQTFPTGTHAMWLYYWLAAHGIDPIKDVKTLVIPPPQIPGLHEILHGGRGELPVPLARRLVPHAAPALGTAQARHRLPRHRPGGEPDRALRRSGQGVFVPNKAVEYATGFKIRAA